MVGTFVDECEDRGVNVHKRIGELLYLIFLVFKD